jgi:hypothetical protein
MPIDSRFPTTLMAAALAAAFPGAVFAQVAARVDFAAGDVVALARDGRSRPLTRGAEVQVGETVSTQQGRAQMRFTDGAYVSLQPQTDFRVDTYVFDGRGSANESAVMSLLKGGLRTITGLIGRTNRDGYRLQTSTATVGIRGTSYAVTYDAGGSVTVFVADGAISISNDAGTTVLPGGNSAVVGNRNAPPATSTERPFLPPAGSTAPTTTVTPPQNPTQDAQTPLLPVSPTLLTGTLVNTDPDFPNFALSSGIQTFSGHAPSATLNAQGILTAYQVSGFEGISSDSSGSAQLSLAGNDGIIAWGRWIGGITGNGVDLNTNGPLHWIVGLPATNMPTTGSASYSMLGATASCVAGCSTAAVTSSNLTVNFGPSGVTGGNLTTSMNITGTPIGTFSGSIVNEVYPSLGKSGFYTFTCCGGSLTMAGEGFVAGPGASRAGLAYQVFGTLGEGPATEIRGVVAYKKN